MACRPGRIAIVLGGLSLAASCGGGGGGADPGFDDQAVLLALEISSPLPPLPSYFPFDTLDGRLGFLYNLDPTQVTFPSQQ